MRWFVAAVALWIAAAGSPAARAEGACTEACVEESRACASDCRVSPESATPEQLQCRRVCLKQYESCRCDCGDGDYCAEEPRGGCRAPGPVAQSRPEAPKVPSRG
jgi:hypothetical protein